MLILAVGVGLMMPSVGPQLVRPGMPFGVARALIGETPNILNRTNNRIREVEFPRARVRLVLDDTGRVQFVNGEGEEIAAETELQRIAKALPEGFNRSGYRPILKAGEKPNKQLAQEGYARIRVAKMTSETTAKITVSFYTDGADGEAEHGTMFLYLSWYRDWWTVTKQEGYIVHESMKNKLHAFIDEVSGNQSKP